MNRPRPEFLDQIDAEIAERYQPDEPGIDALAELQRFAVTDQQVQTMQETRLIWRDVIASGHVANWNAPGNGGKTTIAKFAAAEMARQGFAVLFFQEDAGAGDLPGLHEHAKANGYTLLNSTLSGSTPDAQLDVLNRLVHGGSDLGNVVMFIDTLKKYCDLMSKGGARDFFKLMRGLTQRGATVILLGHTNKHTGSDGSLVFEGVGDVRNDVDELFYIESAKVGLSRLVTLTMRPDKWRCNVKTLSLELDLDSMELKALDRVVDVRDLERQEIQRREDQPINQAIAQALRQGGMNRTELIDSVAAVTGYGTKAVRRVLERHTTRDEHSTAHLWLETPMRFKNTRHIAPHPKVAPLPNCHTGRTADPAELAELDNYS